MAKDVMQLSENTLGILKHFVAINKAILIEPSDGKENGTRIYSRSDNRATIATALLPEKFKTPFITSDLGRFLSMCSLFKSPVFDFRDDNVLIKEAEGSQKVTFYNTQRHIVEAIQPNKTPSPEKVKDVAIEFSLTAELLEKLRKGADLLGNMDIEISANDGKVVLRSLNRKNQESGNTFEVETDCAEDCKGQFFIKKGNLLVRPVDYIVKVYNEGVISMISQSSQVDDEVYWILAEYPEAD